MRKEDKSTIIEQIAATVKEYGHFYLVDVTAMNAAATSALRRDCFKSDIKLMVIKNTLLHKALESLEEDFSPLYDSLKGTTAIMFLQYHNVLNTKRKNSGLKAAKKVSTLLQTIGCFSQSRGRMSYRCIALLQSPAKSVFLLSSGGKHPSPSTQNSLVRDPNNFQKQQSI